MAFCNSCGAALNAGTQFCNKCGVAVAAGPTVPGVTSTPLPPPPPSKGGGSTLKIILIVVAVFVGIGILGIVTIGVIGYRVAKSARVTQEGDHVKVESPFGTIETSKDPVETAKDLGVEVYPGAEVQKNGTASITIGSMHTVAANFESSDSVDKICNFYKSRFPAANVTTSDQNRCTLVSNDQKNMITINVQGGGDTTKFQITNVSKKSASSN